MFNTNRPVQGALLISEPFMLDPNFERSVIMLCEHQEADGTIGLILNNRSTLQLSDMIEDVQNEKFALYHGGPVETDTLFFLHCAYDKLLSGTQINKEIFWGGDFERLITLINEDLIGIHEVKFFLGYSGWAPQQLEEEIAQNSWAIHSEFNSALTFESDGEDLWKKALISLGPKICTCRSVP